MEECTNEIRRGDIYYIMPVNTVGSEQAAGRPAIVVSNDIGNSCAPVIEVVFLTTQHKNCLPTHVSINSAPRPSTAMCEQINTVSLDRVGSFAGRCTDNEMALVGAALMISLELDTCDIRASLADLQSTQKSNVNEASELRVKNAMLTDMYNNLLSMALNNKGMA